MRIDVGGRSNDINSGSHDAALRGKQEENNIEIGRAMYSNVSALILRWYQPAQTETCPDILRKLIRVKLSILLGFRFVINPTTYFTQHARFKCMYTRNRFSANIVRH